MNLRLQKRNHQRNHQFPALKSVTPAAVFILLAITIWIAYFWYYASFGLYSDDHGRIARGMQMGLPGLLHTLQNYFLMKTGQGRPLHDGFIFLFPFIGSRLGGLQALYWLGYAIATLNSILFYILLRRLSLHQVFAVTGALAFCLVPADPSKIFLTHAFGIQTSLTFLLVALYSYLVGRKKWSYLLIFGSLITYETMFPVFLAAPLLQKKWDARLKRELLGHALILGAMMFSMFFIRKVMGDGGRAENLDLLSAISIPIRHTIIGSVVSITSFLYRPIQTLLALDGKMIILLLICFAGFVWILSQLKLEMSSNILSRTNSVKSKAFRLRNSDFLKHLAKLAAIGLVMLVLAYPITFTTKPTAFYGHGGKAHSAAILGASILCACACSAILFIANAYRKRRLATLGLAGFFALLVGVGLLVQQDYALAWQYQRSFWTDAIRLSPDLTDGTVILVDGELKRTKHWQILQGGAKKPSVVLRNIYRFPQEWKNPPRLYSLLPQWQDAIVSDENLLDLNYSTVLTFSPDPLRPHPFGFEEHFDKVESSNVIFLEANNGRLARRTEPLVIDGREFPLKEISTSKLPLLEKGHLYNNYLNRSPDEESVNYLKTN